MTSEEAKRLYVLAGGHENHTPEEWNDIRNELAAVVAAKSDRAAGKTIQWWGCWSTKDTATAFARKIRQLNKP